MMAKGRPWYSHVLPIVGFIVPFEAVSGIAVLVHWPRWLVLLFMGLGVLAGFWPPLNERQKGREQRGGTIERSLALRPTRLDEVSVFDAGVSEPIAPATWSSALAGTYISRPQEEGRIRQALLEHPKRFIMVLGPSRAGKSRTTLEVLTDVFPQRKLVAPRPGDCLRELLDLDPPFELAGSVVWLDDFDRFLPEGSGAGVSKDTVLRLAEHPDTVVVATMRSSEFDKYGPGAKDITRDVEDVLALASPVVRLDPLKSLPPDLQTLNPYFTATVREFGLGAALTAGPALIDRLVGGASDCGVAVSRAAIDWRRAGVNRPVPEAVLSSLYPAYLARHSEASESAFASGLAWACEEVWPGAKVALLLAVDSRHPRGFAVSDYLVDHAVAEDYPVPIETWETILRLVEINDLVGVGMSAFLLAQKRHGHDSRSASLSIAEKAWRRAAVGGVITAMPFLGNLLAEQGQTGESEVWLRRAAEAGDANGINGLGVVLWERGQTDEAERWLRQAAESGHPVARFNLGRLLLKKDEDDESEEWLRKSAEAGLPMAWSLLGMLMRKQSGRDDESEEWLRRGAEAGDANGMCNLGLLLLNKGEAAEGERWLRSAAEEGPVPAMSHLGLLLWNKGNLTEAELWLRRAADAADIAAMCNLGLLLWNKDEIDEAESWLRKAAEADDPSGMCHLGRLLASKGLIDEAEKWLRPAAEAGDVKAMSGLGVLLLDKDESVEAETWFQQASETSDVEAMFNLGMLLIGKGEINEAEGWLRRAAKAGDPEAMCNLGALLSLEKGESAEAERWFRQAAEAGSAEAMSNLSAMLHRQGKIPAAEKWLRRAADAGNANGMCSLGMLLVARGETDEAMTWLRRAANAGSGEATSILGLLSEEGTSGEGET